MRGMTAEVELVDTSPLFQDRNSAAECSNPVIRSQYAQEPSVSKNQVFIPVTVCLNYWLDQYLVGLGRKGGATLVDSPTRLGVLELYPRGPPPTRSTFSGIA
jgi:hypothetical protein